MFVPRITNLTYPYPGAPTGTYSVSVYAAEGRALIETGKGTAARFGETRVYEKSTPPFGRSNYRVRATRLVCCQALRPAPEQR